MYTCMVIDLLWCRPFAARTCSKTQAVWPSESIGKWCSSKTEGDDIAANAYENTLRPMQASVKYTKALQVL